MKDLFRDLSEGSQPAALNNSKLQTEVPDSHEMLRLYFYAYYCR